MSGTLAMAQGSCEPPLFLDLNYHGGENKGENPVILVGSGIISSLYTANANRRCKPHEMVRMPGDIGGVAVTRAVAELKLPINLRMIIPLVENIQGCNFMQPGSRVILMGGSAVHIYGSEVAGQLVLAEAYSNNFKPRVVLSVSSSCPCLVQSIRRPAAPAFTPLDSLSTRIRLVVYHTGDRVVRLPL
uniref:Cytosol aminopeptidase domain-containing protein n=1 Tax=Timema poppense TaxID=170557 RepID=A0A7R9CQL5_TIMPO|nr:unnamed protein product [Timema poppensis]